MLTSSNVNNPVSIALCGFKFNSSNFLKRIITWSSDGDTNFESTNFVEVWRLYLFLCTISVDNKIHFREKNAGFVDSKFVKPSDEHAIRVGWYYVVHSTSLHSTRIVCTET